MATQPQGQPSPFPAPSKSASEIISSSLTTATCMSFTDKLLITVTSSSTSGKLPHWVHVPLATAAADPVNPSFNSISDSSAENSLLPRTDLTATTVLGGTKREDEVVGQTLATTLASAILVKRPSEERMLVLGLGLQGLSGNGEGEGEVGREGFEGVVGLCLQVL